MLATLRMYARFMAGLPGYLRRPPITLDQAEESLRAGLAARENNFLAIVRRGIYQHPGSPYLPLLRSAGCELGDIEASVRDKGIEPTLMDLRRNGVYFTFEEYKGRQPVVRGGKEIRVDERDFDNPLTAKAFEGQTGGSTGAGTRVETDLDNLLTQAPHLMVGRAVNGLIGVPMAVWYGNLPDPTGIGIYLRAVTYRGQPVRWFVPGSPDTPKPALKYRLASQYVLLVSRLCGVACPWPEDLPMERAEVVARWAAEAVRKHGGCEVVSPLSLAVRVCLAARDAGIDLTGASFFGGGEPFTEAKTAAIESSGARYVSIYIAEDTGPIGLQCAAPLEHNDVHLMEDGVALIQYPREVLNSGVEVDAFNLTSLRRMASKILLNVESDDFGIVEERSCGCRFEALGFRRHVRRIRSFGKLTGEGVTLVGSEMVRILEEVLPARFGGGPQDFQLLEEEDPDTGYTRLVLLANPGLDIPDDNALIEAMMAALEDSSVAAGLARNVWQQAETFKVRRQAPIWTGRGKLPSIVRAGLHGS